MNTTAVASMIFAKKEVSRPSKFDRPVRILNEEVHAGGEYVPQGNRAQVGAHDQGFHFFRRLRVGKFQVRHRDHDFRRGQHQKGEDLPDDIRMATGVDADLDQRHHQKCGRSSEQAQPDLSQRRQTAHPVDGGIDGVGEKRQQDENENRIDRLNLGREHSWPRRWRSILSA